MEPDKTEAQKEAEAAANAAVDSLKKDPNIASQDNQASYRGPTAAEMKAREQAEVRTHPFVTAVKELLDALAPEPKLGKVESTYTAVRREYNEITGAIDARAVITGAGSEHEELRYASEAAD